MTQNLTKIRHIVAIAAGKGGVGKSTCSLNLALFFQKKGFRVGLLDADLYGPSLRKMLPEQTSPIQHPEHQERIIPAESKGIKLISMAYFLSDDNPTSVRAPIANGIIKQFIHCVEWGELDFLFIDFPPGTGDIQLTLVQEIAFSGVVLVTTPQEIALLDVAKATTMFQKMQVPVIGVLENMSYYLTGDGCKVYPFGQGGGERFALQNGYVFLGHVPIDASVSACCDQGKSLFEERMGEVAAVHFAKIAVQIEEQLAAFEKLSDGYLKNFEVTWK